MKKFPDILRTNTILYCDRWRESVTFYESALGLAISFRNDWLVEFRLTDTAYLSVAEASRTRIAGGGGNGLTLSLQVADIDHHWTHLSSLGTDPTPIQDKVLDARVFYFLDPEGRRIEMWTPHRG